MKKRIDVKEFFGGVLCVLIVNAMIFALLLKL